MVSFIDAFKLPLKQLLIASLPKLCINKDTKAVDNGDFVPKRSVRLAAKSKFRALKLDA
jgi:hypothetical protein